MVDKHDRLAGCSTPLQREIHQCAVVDETFLPREHAQPSECGLRYGELVLIHSCVHARALWGKWDSTL